MKKHHTYAIAILISGNGSNLQAIIDAVNTGKLTADIALVLSDRENAFGIERAKKANIATNVVNPKNYSSRQEFDQALTAILDHCNPDLIVLAGFMRILGASFVQHFKGRLINIHPSLLPAYQGLNTHEKVLAAKEKMHGTTIHFVTEALDNGPIIAQAKLMVQPNDTPETLKHRVQALEHIAYPEVIRWFAEKNLKWQADGIYFAQQKIPSNGLIIKAEKLIKNGCARS